MNVFNHLGISRTVINNVERRLKIRLDRRGFMYGSIKPDIKRSLSSIPHYKNNVMDFVALEIKALLEMGIRNKKCTREFSERLGLVTHYLSDFFCYAHSEYFKGNMLEHHLYENKLSLYCRNNRIVIGNNIINRLEHNELDYISICRHIDYLHNEYLKEGDRPSLARDMKYTMEMTISFSMAAIRTCLLDDIETAA